MVAGNPNNHPTQEFHRIRIASSEGVFPRHRRYEAAPTVPALPAPRLDPQDVRSLKHIEMPDLTLNTAHPWLRSKEKDHNKATGACEIQQVTPP